MTDALPLSDRPPRAATGRAASGCPRQASPASSLFTRLRIGALACLALLTLQILAAGLPQPPAGSAPLFAQELLGDRIVICTSAGLVVIDRQTGERIATETAPSQRTDGAPVDGAHDGAFCLFCLPLLHGDSQTPPSVECPAPPSPPVLWRPIPASSDPLIGRPSGSAWPRGPPPTPTI
ncbi:hypothetical protein A6A40_25195 (plasmid) [Azospirillum humicireducens]|uniref:DUF2946 domain-containing protein n=1 Tax=Azospirillum humicireducens TaxID=1226968 RepID=A0A2R4VV52_9PROT|nr:DUF2946 family protein [Azospirillum humicireducens]AWB08336.1 hypothetical protein A6A40_25195 [Azospirillum humicireducens]